MASEWQIIKDLYKGFGNNPRNTETFEALANMNPLFSAYRGAKTLSNVDVSPMRQSLLNEAYGISDPNVNRQAANQVKDTLFGLLDVAPVAGAATPAIKAGGKTLAKEAARQIETGTGLLGSTAIDPRMYITAYHGSPSVFNKFDTKFSKTGAGAEAYGPGTYLSESQDLAKGYQPRSDKLEDSLSKLSERAYDKDNYIAADIYDNFLLHKTPEEVKSAINEMYQGKDLIEANKALNQATKLYQSQSKGGLYKVDLPDENLPYFLNWDEPISSQSKEIQDLAKQYKLNPDDKGEKLIGAVGGVEAAAKKLPEYGLKGVKYFDTYSPGAGSGASNYVVYDPSIVKILERNGLLLP
jgi:hypothetical protein